MGVLQMNGYFQLEFKQNGSFLKIIPATEGGKNVSINEVAEYLKKKNFIFDLAELNKKVLALSQNGGAFLLDNKKHYPEREMLTVRVSEDKMNAYVRFYPPSTDGTLLTKEDILADLNSAKITFGVDKSAIDKYIANREYLTDFIFATGKPVRHGSDASIEYYFNTDLKARPTLKEDGSVDFFNLNTVNHIKEGDLLAKLTPEDAGDVGTNVFGEKIKPRDVKHLKLKYGHNIRISEDHTMIYSEVSGHVNLFDDKVFVSNVFETENIDNSTGDINYDGSVKINGNVNSNFSVRAKGNIEVSGVVEAAYIEADGDVIIAKGINGMGKGIIRAGGNVIVKYVENAEIFAGGYVETEAVMHSKISAGTEINVVSKKGFISGSSVSATQCISVKSLGSQMGGDTVVELGIDPYKRERYNNLRSKIDSEQKAIAQLQPVVVAFAQKLKQGVKLSPEQMKSLQEMSGKLNILKESFENDVEEFEDLEDNMIVDTDAKIVVKDTVFAGTKIIISDSSLVVKKDAQYCKFIRERGEIKITSL